MRLSSRPWRLVALAALVLASVTAAGCSRFGAPDPASEQGESVLTLWRGFFVTALFVAGLVWGLLIFVLLRYRRRRTGADGVEASDVDLAPDDLPDQQAYNIPLEVFYTAVPLIMVAVFFYFTARDEDAIMKTSANPDHKITVTGVQWSWQFTYASDGGPETTVTGTPGKPPTLYLPKGESVQFKLESNDVIHSFWVPAFLFKMDVIPGRVNTFEITPQKLGRFRGKCAELCGQDHARMLFNVKVVTPSEYQDYVTRLEGRLAQGSAQ